MSHYYKNEIIKNINGILEGLRITLKRETYLLVWKEDPY